MPKINRLETVLKLNAFRVHENNCSIPLSERKYNLSVIDRLIDTVKNTNNSDQDIRNAINFHGYDSIDMPKYEE